MASMVTAKTGERGATLLLVTFVSTFFLLPIIGVCIDGAVLYWVKARLSAAVDATALAAARSLNVGQTVSEQQSHAQGVGASYFTANFPPGVMRSTVVGGQDISQSININDTGYKKRVVTVTVAVTVRLFFMPILGFWTSTVSATGQATRRDTNVILVLDRSYSMNNSSGSCAALVTDAENFVNQFVDGRDQLGLVTFQSSANVDYAPNIHFKTGSSNLNSVLNTLVCNGDTDTVEGLALAWNQIKTVINQPGALNVIVFFTDGEPNTVVAPFRIKTQGDNRYSVSSPGTAGWTPASSCTGTGFLPDGALADGTHETAADITGLNPTGATIAVFQTPAVPITTWAGFTPVANSTGCSFNNPPNYFLNARQDIAFIPTTDSYGNSTVDGGYIPLDYFPVGSQYPNQIRPDMPRTVRWAAFNAADSQAYRIRTDPVYTIITYTIGLQGNEPMAFDQDFMERIANDPRASNYDKTKPAGEFILANDNLQLAQAFQQIASEILRLSQ